MAKTNTTAAILTENMEDTTNPEKQVAQIRVLNAHHAFCQLDTALKGKIEHDEGGVDAKTLYFYEAAIRDAVRDLDEARKVLASL